MLNRLWHALPFSSRDMSCLKLREMASEYLDGTMGAKEVWKFNYHSEKCGGCNAFVSSLKATIQTIQSLPSQTASEELKQRLRQQFLQEPPKDVS